MKSFEFYDRFLMKAVEILTTVLMFVLVGLVFFQVLNRFILHIPAAWTEEMARYNFVWLSLFGSVIALKSGRHLSVDLVVQGIKSQKAQDWVKVMVALLVLVFSLILTWSGYPFTASNWTTHCEFGAFPLALIYAAVPVTGFLLLLVSLEQLARSVRDIVR
ncbi:MAG: TRAP transporter small permease [Synergistaceae bacterium]|nr:TRAP transporter small permease [Synergistaceae bacterium]